MSRLESLRQTAEEPLSSYLNRVDLLRYQATIPDDWLVNNVRARVLPQIQEMIQRRIANDVIDGRPPLIYDNLRKYLETYEREAIPDASIRSLRTRGDDGNRAPTENRER